MADSIRVLHVDDEPDFADMAARFLEREDERIEVCTETSASDGIERLASDEFDCVISDYDMSGQNGIEFLDTVRTEYPDLPFILFTGKGSEEVASDAISKGATDYLQKGGGTEQYQLLANRVGNAVEQYRSARRQRESILSTYDQLPFGILVETLDRGVLTANEQFCEFFDVPGPDAIVGRDRERAAEEMKDQFQDPEAFLTRTNELITRREAVLAEILRFEDGRVFERSHLPLELPTGEGSLWIYEDVTERVEREQQLRALFDNASVAIAYTEFENGQPIIQAVNAAFEQTFGYDADTVIGRNLDEFVVPATREPEATDINQRVRAGEQFGIEVQRQTTDGTRDFLLRSVPLQPGESGERSYAVYRDITERKEYERQLERQNERLEAFASVVSHDLRNPLNVAQGHLDLVRAECDSEYLDDVVHAHDRMDALIEDLLALATEGERVSEMEPVDLADTVERCWQTVETAEATLLVDTDLTILADRSRFLQLLENLMGNAVEHGSTSPGSAARQDGADHGSTSSRPEADDAVEHGGEDVTITVGDLDDGTGFYVADDGPGIPEDEVEQVFETGYSTAGEGTGFGLSIVEEIAEAHDWTVSVTTSDDGGARFEIRGVEVVS